MNVKEHVFLILVLTTRPSSVKMEIFHGHSYLVEFQVQFTPAKR